MLPSWLRSKKHPTRVSSSRITAGARLTRIQASSWSFRKAPPRTVSAKWRSMESWGESTAL
jgi:hypothetical protein